MHHLGEQRNGNQQDTLWIGGDTTYYWQVKAVKRAVTLFGTTYANASTTSFWSFTTGSPAAFNKSSPTNAATNQPGTITLKWNASNGVTTYYYCIDTPNDGKCTTWVNNGTATSKTLTGLAINTTYYWQVKAVNATGTTYANGATTAFWSFKTGVPAAFVKSSPAKGALNQPVAPTIKWAASQGATAYYYCYDTSNDGKCTTWINNGTATSKTLSGLAANTTYYWQVKAVNTYELFTETAPALLSGRSRPAFSRSVREELASHRIDQSARQPDVKMGGQFRGNFLLVLHRYHQR
jgi:hypothetical protein